MLRSRRGTRWRAEGVLRARWIALAGDLCGRLPTVHAKLTSWYLGARRGAPPGGSATRSGKGPARPAAGDAACGTLSLVGTAARPVSARHTKDIARARSQAHAHCYEKSRGAQNGRAGRAGEGARKFA